MGLAIARMMAHITYLSDASMDRKFGRKAVRPRSASGSGSQHSALNSQLSAPSDSMEGLDAVAPAATSKRTSKVAATHGSLEKAFAGVEASTLVVGFTSDWLFPPDQNRDIALALLRAGKRVSYAELSTDLGHDSFLLESPQLYDLVRGFLD